MLTRSHGFYTNRSSICCPLPQPSPTGSSSNSGQNTGYYDPDPVSAVLFMLENFPQIGLGVHTVRLQRRWNETAIYTAG